ATALTGTVRTRLDPAIIAGAAKLSGRVADRTTVSLLDSVTLGVDAETDGAGTAARIPVREALAPANNFGVLRVPQDILSGSAVGATIVGVTPLDHTDTFHAAYAGGFDLALQTRDHTYTALAQVVGSLLLGGDEGHAVRQPDGTVIHNQSSG